jgi:hypothetical protein
MVKDRVGHKKNLKIGRIMRRYDNENDTRSFLAFVVYSCMITLHEGGKLYATRVCIHVIIIR